MLATLKRDGKAILLQSVLGAFFLVVFLFGASALSGALQQNSDAVAYQKAIACELAVPIGPTGRDQADVSKCFTDQGVEPPNFTSDP